MKKFLLIILAAQGAFAGISADKVYKLNRYMGPVGSQVALGTLIDEGGSKALSKDGFSPVKIIQATYDYAVYGGASNGDINLGMSIPDNAIITKAFLDVIIAPTSGTNASIALKTEGAGDILAATTIGSVTGILTGVPTGASTTGAVKMTAERSLVMNVTLGALTAGRFKVYLQYVMSE